MNKIRLMALLGASVALVALASPAAHAGVIVTSATYGVNQTKAPGMATATCFQRPNINLKDAVNTYCSSNSVGGICLYKVPWPSASVDPGLGCYKSFDVSYRCAGSDVVKQKTIGGYTDEAANQVVEFDCSPATTGIVGQVLQSNGNTVSAQYFVPPSKVGQPNSNGTVPINPLVLRKSAADTDYEPSENTLTCASTPSLMINSKGIGDIAVEYEVTGFSNVAGNPEVSSANVDFSLTVNGAACSGSFEYFRDRQNRVEADFFLMVNGFQIPLNIGYLAPDLVSPSLVSSSGSSMLTPSRIRDAIISSQRPRTRTFWYDLVYLNKYGLTAGDNLSCTFGNSAPVSFQTDANTGRVRIQGSFTVAEAGRDANQNMTWAVTTSLTGTSPIFTLKSGQGTGAVTCKSSDDPPAVYTYDLGTW